jgi:outer membrane murein-binding lipoprotein Lpp
MVICDTATMRRALLVLAVLSALFLSGCGSEINSDGAAKSVVDVVARQTKFKPKDVTCPSGVDAEVGIEFDCKFTGPEGKEYTAHMKVTKVEGDNVEFYVESKPS